MADPASPSDADMRFLLRGIGDITQTSETRRRLIGALLEAARAQLDNNRHANDCLLGERSLNETVRNIQNRNTQFRNRHTLRSGADEARELGGGFTLEDVEDGR